MCHLEVVLLQKMGNSRNCNQHSNIDYHSWIHRQNNHDPLKYHRHPEIITTQFRESCIHYCMCEATKGTLASLELSPLKWFLPARLNNIHIYHCNWISCHIAVPYWHYSNYIPCYDPFIILKLMALSKTFHPNKKPTFIKFINFINKFKYK